MRLLAGAAAILALTACAEEPPPDAVTVGSQKCWWQEPPESGIGRALAGCKDGVTCTTKGAETTCVKANVCPEPRYEWTCVPAKAAAQ